jgi:signal transduction histidine kinase/CheY-like chemotaxis protein
MKLVRRKKQEIKEEAPQPQSVKKDRMPGTGSDFYDANTSSWKVLIVDDEPDVHAITKLSLKNFSFANKPIEFLNAMSGEEAREILKNNPGIAVAMIDVVMETEDAGLRLVRFIREELRNTAIRLIIRTGQPGAAPERYVIDHYDIDDYKDKTELIAQKLYTTIRSAIKAYRDISIIHRNREGLEKILNAAPQLYRIQTMEQFFEGVLTQMIGYCNLGNHNLISTINGFLAISDGSKVSVRAGTGRFKEDAAKAELDKLISETDAPEKILPANSLSVPLKINNETRGFIYMEDAGVTEEDLHLIHIMANQCAAALQNLILYNNLEAANKMNEKKNQFLGMAAHDLRNPLAGVEMSLDMVLDSARERLDADELELLNMAKILNESAMRLVSDLLDIAKIESGKLELELLTTDILSVIKESLEMNRFLAESKHIKTVLNAEESPEMMIDPARIHQVLNNLISNAVKYSQPQTTVYVNLSKPSEQEIIISVQDKGQGIPQHEIGKLFQPFSKASVRSTAGEESTGLGLVICKKIVEAHGGRVWLESEVGKGSTFYVSLPVILK